MIIENYIKKIPSFNVKSSSGSHQIFKHWKGICNYTINVQNNEISTDSNILNFEDINIHDKNGNMLLFYIVNEWKSLLSFNDNKGVKSNLSLMIIDFINVLFNLYNEEKYKYKMEYKQFYYFIHSATYIDDIKDTIGQTEGIYEEYTEEGKEKSEEEKEALEDAMEEEGALDMEGDEIDYASLYDRNFSREPREDFQDFNLSYREYQNILSLNDYYS